MTRVLRALVTVAWVGVTLPPELAFAQDLVVTNARIVTGTGRTIDRGSIVVDGGRIVSVSAGDASAGGSVRLDARGITVLPGLNDTHRHVLQTAAAETQAELERFTDEEVADM